MVLILPTDDLLLANLDVPSSVDKKLPQKSFFARHKSIAIQPNSLIVQDTTSSTTNPSNNSKINDKMSGFVLQPAKKSEPLASSVTSTPSKPILVRHKSMPSPNRKFVLFSFELSCNNTYFM